MSWVQVCRGTEGLENGDVSHAWSIWSSAAEAAIADAHQFSGGPVPDRGLVLGRGAFLVRTVRLGGPKVRKARRNFADPLEGGDVFMYRGASSAVLLDLGAGLKLLGMCFMLRFGMGLLWLGLLSSQFSGM